MSFFESRSIVDPIARVFKGSLDFKGRAQRTDGVVYWMVFNLLLIVIMGAVVAIASLDGPSLMRISGFITFLFQLPVIAWSVRRAHDHGWSGLWVIPLWIFVMALPAAELIFGANILPDNTSLIGKIIGIFVSVPALCLLFWDPDDGDNRFGANPRLDLTPDLGEE